MSRYDHIMVCLDDFDRDDQMLAYLRKIVPVFRSRSVHLVYVNEKHWRMLSSPGYTAEFRMRVPAFSTDEIERERREDLVRLEKLGRQYLGDISGCDLSCQVLNGPPLVEILTIAGDLDADLIVVGRAFGEHSKKGAKAILARRIARRSTCSVLTLPENGGNELKRILVPCRDSACSLRALETAVEISRETHAFVEALNVYSVFAGHGTMASNYRVPDSKFRMEAEEECRRLIELIDTQGVELAAVCVEDRGFEPVSLILSRRAHFDADLVVIGARGRTGAAGVFLGSVTQQLMKTSPVPILAVKQKGECIGLFKALVDIWGSGSEIPTKENDRVP